MGTASLRIAMVSGLVILAASGCVNAGGVAPVAAAEPAVAEPVNPVMAPPDLGPETETHSLAWREYGVQHFEGAGLSASAYVSGNTIIFYAGGCDTFTATISSNNKLSPAIVNPMNTEDNANCNQDNESTKRLQEHLDNVAAGLGAFKVLGEDGFKLDGIKFGGAIYDWVTWPALPDNFYHDQFVVTDISGSITDEYWAEIEPYIPNWSQAPDGSVTLIIRGPQSTPDFQAFSPYPVPLNNHIKELVVTEGWAGPIMELSRQWAFRIEGVDGTPLFPEQVRFIRYDDEHEQTIIPKR